MLGSATDKTPGGYRLEVQLDQKGAGVETLLSSRYDAEFEGRKNPHLPLQLIRRDPAWPASLSLTLSGDQLASERKQAAAENPEAEGDDAEQARRAVEPKTCSTLFSGRSCATRQARSCTRSPATDPGPGKTIEGQQVTFRTTASNGVIVTKTFRLWQNADGFEVDLKFESPDKERSFSYNLLGPHGIPIEGEWYTEHLPRGLLRHLCDGETSTQGRCSTAYDIVKSSHGPESTSRPCPLWFAGVENQYFATFVAPYPPPTSDEDADDSETKAVLLHKDEKALQKSDVGVEISRGRSRSGPNAPVVHTYRVFAGPKTGRRTARPYGRRTLAAYRKS